MDTRDPPPTTPPDATGGARWRLRAAAADSREHVDLPLEDPPGDLADAPQRPLRDAELWLLARRTQSAALRVDLELRSAVVRQVFRRDFVYVSRLLHALEASRRVQGLDRASLDDALATLQRCEEDAHELLDRIQAGVAARIAAQPRSGAQVAFAHPARFQATVVCPFARRHLALLMHADDVLAHLERAWLAGALDPPRDGTAGESGARCMPTRISPATAGRPSARRCGASTCGAGRRRGGHATADPGRLRQSSQPLATPCSTAPSCSSSRALRTSPSTRAPGPA